ncbi:hypothetical protein ACFLZH_05400 [Patescibacteria group bacterium]
MEVVTEETIKTQWLDYVGRRFGREEGERETSKSPEEIEEMLVDFDPNLDIQIVRTQDGEDEFDERITLTALDVDLSMAFTDLLDDAMDLETVKNWRRNLMEPDIRERFLDLAKRYSVFQLYMTRSEGHIQDVFEGLPDDISRVPWTFPESLQSEAAQSLGELATRQQVLQHYMDEIQMKVESALNGWLNNDNL